MRPPPPAFMLLPGRVFVNIWTNQDARLSSLKWAEPKTSPCPRQHE